MTNAVLKDIKFLRMWPRKLFEKKNKNRLMIKKEVPALEGPGVYMLYRGDDLYYVGKANRLYRRLHDHSNKATDEYYAHWDHFSAFAIVGTAKKARTKMTEFEAILIAAVPTATNRSKPRFNPVRIPRSLLTLRD